MTAGITIDTSEVRALASDMRRHTAEFPAQARVVVLKGGYDMLAEVQATVPVDTGHLKASESLDELDGGLGFELGPTASYGDYVERGTSRMAAQPSLAPAFDHHEPIIAGNVGDLAAHIVRAR